MEDVVVLHTGIGRAACERQLGEFLSRESPRLIISSGFAGAVVNDLTIGTLIVAENFSDAGLTNRAIRAFPSIQTRPLHTADKVVDDSEERRHIAQTTGAAVIDMETCWIARACSARNIPLLSVRIVSDTPRRPFPAPPEVLFDVAQQRTNIVRLTNHLLRHPTGIPRLIAFSRRIARLREDLSDALATVVTALAP